MQSAAQNDPPLCPQISYSESLAAALSMLTPAVLTFAAERAAGVPAFSEDYTWYTAAIGFCIAGLLLWRRPGYAAGCALFNAVVLAVCVFSGAVAWAVFPISTRAVTEVTSFIATCVMFLPIAISLCEERPRIAALEAEQARHRLRERLKKQREGKELTFANYFLLALTVGTFLVPVIITIFALILSLAQS